jgi:hypothetical protein
VNVERHHRTVAGLIGGDGDLGVRGRRLAVGVDVIASKEFDRRARRWKVDRDFVGKRVGSTATKHLGPTIEA